MLNREEHLMIKQLRQQGTFLVDIAHQIGCCEKTVSRHLTMAQAPTGRRKRKPIPKLEPYKAFIDRRLADHVWNAEVIFQEIKEQGYRGGRAMVRRYIQPKRPLRESKQTVRFETLPGHQLQHDWGEIKADVGGQRCTVNFAVNTLGYSRRFHVFAAPRQDAEHTYESLVRCFGYFGGGVKQVVVDNQKAAVLKHYPNGKVVFNEGFLQLATHYAFSPHACRPRRARTKGKTERMVGYVKHHFFARYREFDSFEQLNQLLEQWLATVADNRVLRQFGQTPQARFSEEVSSLTTLPREPFDTSYVDIRQVAWDAYIEVRGNRYSVPDEWCGKAVRIRIGLDEQLRVYADEELIATHRLQSGKRAWQTQPAHHQALWKQCSQVQQRSLQAYEEML